MVLTRIILKHPIGNLARILKIADVGQGGWSCVQRGSLKSRRPLANFRTAVSLHKERVHRVRCQTGYGDGIGGYRGCNCHCGIVALVILDVPLRLRAGTPSQVDAVGRGVCCMQVRGTETVREGGEHHIVNINRVGGTVAAVRQEGDVLAGTCVVIEINVSFLPSTGRTGSKGGNQLESVNVCGIAHHTHFQVVGQRSGV